MDEPQLESLTEISGPEAAAAVIAKSAQKKAANGNGSTGSENGVAKPEAQKAVSDADVKIDATTQAQKADDKEAKATEDTKGAAKDSKGSKDEQASKPARRERKSIKDILKRPDFGEAKAEGAQEDNTDYKSAYEEAKKYLEDPAVKTIIEGRKNGHNIFDILDKVRGKNTKSMSDGDVYAMKLKQLGAKSEGDDDFNEDSDISYESEMRKFNDMPAIQRKREIASIRAEFDAEADSRIKDFLLEASKPSETSQELADYDHSLDRLSESAVGQTAFGITLTKDMVNDVISDLRQSLYPTKEGGQIDANKLFELRVLDRYFKTIVENIHSAAYTDGVDTISDEVQATPDSAIHDRTPDIQPKFEKGSEEEAEAVSGTLRPYVPVSR